MTIEATLERIATALEQIANNAPKTDVPSDAEAAQAAAWLRTTLDPYIPKPESVRPTPQDGADTPKSVASTTTKGKKKPVAEEKPAVPTVAAAPAEANPAAPAQPTTTAESPANAAADTPITYLDLQTAATHYSLVGDRDGVLAIFAQFEIKTLKQLKENQWPAVIAAFNTATAEINNAKGV